MTRVAAIVALLGALTPWASPQDGWQVVEEARMAVRRGLLSEAEQALLVLDPVGDRALDAHRNLLLGNVEFERGRFTAAVEHYRSAARAFEAAGDEASAAVARSNLTLGEERLRHREEQERRLRTLRSLVFGCLGLGALSIALAARRASARVG